jgi:hypothetical protein
LTEELRPSTMLLLMAETGPGIAALPTRCGRQYS